MNNNTIPTPGDIIIKSPALIGASDMARITAASPLLFEVSDNGGNNYPWRMMWTRWKKDCPGQTSCVQLLISVRRID